MLHCKMSHGNHNPVWLFALILMLILVVREVTTANFVMSTSEDAICIGVLKRSSLEEADIANGKS